MSVSQSTTLLAPVVVAVAPTETTLASFVRDDLKRTERITVQIENSDASQLFAGTIYRRQTGMTLWAPSPETWFAAIPAGESRAADLDVYGTDELEVRGYMSGLGADITIGAIRVADAP